MIAMLIVMLILLISGVRIANALAISFLFYLICYSDMSVMVLAQRISVGADSIVMLALPFFLLAGELIECLGYNRTSDPFCFISDWKCAWRTIFCCCNN